MILGAFKHFDLTANIAFSRAQCGEISEAEIEQCFGLLGASPIRFGAEYGGNKTGGVFFSRTDKAITGFLRMTGFDTVSFRQTP